MYSGLTSTAGFTNFSPLATTVLSTFLVPFSIISETGEIVFVETNSLDISFPSTVNTLTTSIFFPSLPCCLILVVPSGNWLLFSIIWLYCIVFSIVLSEYNNSALISFPANTSSWGFTVLTPKTFLSSCLFVFPITFLPLLLFNTFLSVLSKLALFPCFLSVTFTSVISFNCGCFLLFCWELTFLFTSSFNFLVSASFFINPTKLYPGIEEILGSLSPTFKL